MQVSNWDLRPLWKTQLHYASVDAFALLDLYRLLNKPKKDKKKGKGKQEENPPEETKKYQKKQLDRDPAFPAPWGWIASGSSAAVSPAGFVPASPPASAVHP